MEIKDYLHISPKVTYIPSYDPKPETGWQGVRACWYEGAPYQGKPTKVFAYIGYPEGKKEQRVPAVVLVHGGGGHAYAHWIKLWNERGYAAIAMDTTGFVPAEESIGLSGVESGPHEKYVRELYGDFTDDAYHLGPANDELRNHEIPLKEQWIYHAVVDTILAHNIFIEDERIDEDKIGIVGVSWGGVVTAVAMGYDTRYAFAIPIYGCGYLGYAVKRTTLEFLKSSVNTMWGPEYGFSDVTFPVLWTCALKDASFCCYSNSRSYLDTKRSGSILSIQAELYHSHVAAWSTEESYRFADCVLQGKLPFVAPIEEPRGFARVQFQIAIPKDYETLQVKIIYLTAPFQYDEDGKPVHEYYAKDVTMNGNMVIAEIPEDTYCYYFEFRGTVADQTLTSTTSLVMRPE